MVDPETAEAGVRRLLQDIQARHAHPKPATYFRSLAQWSELLERIWERLRPRVGDEGYVRARSHLIREAETHVRTWAGPDVAAPGAIAPALTFFHRRLIPDLMLDVGMVRVMLCASDPGARNRFEISGRQDV
jgi:hypothetical protein